MCPRKASLELIASRKSEIRDVALSIIYDQGIEKLTMDKVVDNLPFSKGTVYNYFGCIEDLVVALCNENMKTLIVFLNRAKEMSENLREQLVYVNFSYFVFYKFFSVSLHLMLSAKSPLYKNKASLLTREEHVCIENKIIIMLEEMIDSCMKDNVGFDGVLNSKDMAVQNYSILVGGLVLLENEVDRCVSELKGCFGELLIRNIIMFLDGLNCKCSSSEPNYIEAIGRVEAEIFNKYPSSHDLAVEYPIIGTDVGS